MRYFGIFGLTILLLCSCSAFDEQAEKSYHHLQLIPGLASTYVVAVEGTHLILLDSLKLDVHSNSPRVRRGYPDNIPRRLQALAQSFDRMDINDSGWIAYVTDTGSSVALYRYEPSTGVRQYPPVLPPPTHRTLSILLHENLLIAGGTDRENGEVLGYYNLGDSMPTWTSIPVPDSLMKRGKGIDDLVMHGNRLYAVDNIVIPKWMIVYQIDGENISQSRVVSLPTHGVYEFIRSAEIGASLLVNLSATSGMAAYAQHLTVYDVNSLESLGFKSNVKEAFRFSGYDELRNDTTAFWNAMAFYGSRLYIAAGRSGVGVIDFGSARTAEDVDTVLSRDVVYRKIPGFENSEVLNLVSLAPSDKLGLILFRADSLQSIVVDRENFSVIQLR